MMKNRGLENAVKFYHLESHSRVSDFLLAWELLV